MPRKFYITEKQYKLALKEGILPDNEKIEVNAPIEKYGNNPEEALKDTQDRIKKAGGDLKRFNVSVDGNKVNGNQKLKGTKIVPNTDVSNQNTTIGESNIITKNELQEIRLNEFKRNSRVFKLKDFIKN